MKTNDRRKERVHIGDLIKQKLKEQNRSIAWLGKKTGKERSTMSKILDKPYINTDMLSKISEVLGENFFEHFSEVHRESKKE